MSYHDACSSLQTIMSSTKTLNCLPDELICSICHYLGPVPEFLKTTRAELGHATCQLFSSRFPIPNHLLPLRLVSKRLNRIATPYTWRIMDSDEKVTRKASATDNKRSRNSFHVLSFLSRKDIAPLIQVLQLDVVDYQIFYYETASPTSMDFIQKLLLSLHSLRAINISFLEMTWPLQLSFPGIGLLFLRITTCARTSTFDNDFPFNVRGVGPTKLQAYCTEWLG